MELQLQLALLDVLQVVDHNATGVGSDCDGAAIGTELYVEHVLAPGQSHLLVLVSVGRAVLVDVDLLYFFANVDVEEFDAVVHAATCKKQMVNLRESYA